MARGTTSRVISGIGVLLLAATGVLTATDLSIYEVIERPAVCAEYRDFEVCGMGPPSSGALTVGQILGMLDSYDLASMGPDSPDAWRLIADASRLAFADRGRYMADIDFVPMPLKYDANSQPSTPPPMIAALRPIMSSFRYVHPPRAPAR